MENTEKEAIVSDPQVLGSDLWGHSQPAQPVSYLCIPTEAGAGAGPTLPKSLLGPLGLPGQRQGWPHEPPNHSFESCCGEVRVLSGLRAQTGGGTSPHRSDGRSSGAPLGRAGDQSQSHGRCPHLRKGWAGGPFSSASPPSSLSCSPLCCTPG